MRLAALILLVRFPSQSGGYWLRYAHFFNFWEVVYPSLGSFFDGRGYDLTGHRVEFSLIAAVSRGLGGHGWAAWMEIVETVLVVYLSS